MAQDPKDIFPHDELTDGLDSFSSNLNTANDGFKDFLGQLGNLSGSINKLDKSILQNNNALGTGMAELANIQRYAGGNAGSNKNQFSQTADIPKVRPNVTPYVPFPDVGNLNDGSFAHPSVTKAFTRSYKADPRPTLAGEIGQSYASDANKNLLQAGHSLNPLSFLQYSMMFGASFPVQMKMAEVMTKPVTDVAQQTEVVKGFASGFTGIGDAIQGISGQFSRSPLQSYESIYQSKIMLSSALGGEKQSNAAVDNALKMAREYPVKTEQVLSSLSRLAVYPEVKPHLQSEDFQKKLMETVSGLSLIVPEQGLEGAMFSIVEAMSGSWRSMQMRFNVSPEIIQTMSGMTKSEMSSDPNKLISGLHTFVGKAIGLDVLEKQKFTFSKQVDNFGDSLQILTKSVFERTDLYKSVAGGAAVFQTGFSALAGNQNFVNYLGGIFQPFQNRLDGAFANFAGVGQGAYKTMPMTQVLAAMEDNFKDLSMEEIGAKFEGLIDDLGGIWKDTNNKINSIMSGKMGDVLGKIGGDIASVAGNAFSSMTSAVMSGLWNSFKENPMNIIGPAASMALPLGAILGAVQLIPTAIQSAISGGHIRRGVGQIGNMIWGQSSTQAGDSMIMASNKHMKQVMAGVRSGGIDNLYQADRVASNQFKRVNPNNFNDMLNTHVTELGKVATNVRKTTMDDVSKNIAAGSVNRTAESVVDGRTPQAKLNQIFDDLADVSKMTPAQRQTTQAYHKKLTDAGFSPDEISQIQKSHTQRVVSDLEDQNYVNYGKRELRPDDTAKLRREILEPQFGATYNMSDNAEEMVQAVQKKAAAPGELPFQKGDAITPKHLEALEKRSSVFNKIGDDLSVGSFNEQLAGKQFTKKEISAFASTLNLTPAQLKATPIDEDMLVALKTTAKETRAVVNEVKILNAAFEAGIPFQAGQYAHPAQQFAEATYGGINAAGNVEAARRAFRPIQDYNAQDILGAKTSNRMTRLLNQNADALKDVNIPVDDAMRKTLGLKAGQELNLMQEINTPQFQRLQRGGAAEFFKMSAEDAQIALRGNVAARSVLTDKGLLESVTNQMDVGGRRLGALSYATRAGDFISKSPVLKGAARVAGGALQVLDPLVTGLQVSDIAKNLGASSTNAALAGVGGAAVMGGGLAGFQRSLVTKALGQEGLTRATASAEQLTAAKAVGSSAFTNSLAKVAGLGGGLALLTTGLEIFSQKTAADKEVADTQKNYEKELSNTATLTSEQRQLLSTGASQASEADRRQGGAAGLMDNAFFKTALIGGGVGLAALSGGTLLPLLGMALASAGTTWATGDYFSGSAQESERTKAAKGDARTLAKGVGFYSDRIKQYDTDIGSLQFAKDTGGELTGEEAAKLNLTKKLRKDAASGMGIQLAAINTVAKINSIKDEDQFTDDGGYIGKKQKTTADRLQEYLTDTDNNLPTGKAAVSEYLGAATVDVTGKKSSNAKINKAIETGDTGAVYQLIQQDAAINTNMAKRFNNATQNLDFKDANQVETVRSAEVARLNEMVVPLNGTPEQMNQFRDANQGTLMNQYLKANVLSSIATNPNQKALYSSIETATLNKMQMAGITSPYDILKGEKDGKKYGALEFAKESGSISSTQFSELDDKTKQKLKDNGISKAEDLYGVNVNELVNTPRFTDTEKAQVKKIESLSGRDKEQAFIDLDSGLKNRLNRAGIDSAYAITPGSDYKLAGNAFGENEVNQLKALTATSSKKEQEFKDLQFGTFKTMTQSLYGKEGRDAFEAVDKSQNILKGADLSGFSGEEQINIKRQMDRRGGAIDQLKNNNQLQGLVNKMFSTDGKNVDIGSLSDDQLKQVQGSSEFKSSSFDDTRNAMATLMKTTTNLNGTFSTTKDQVEKKFGTAMEKAATAAENYAGGVTGADKFAATGGTGWINDMKNAINSFRQTGNTQKATAEADFQDVVGKDASLKNLTSSLGITSVAGLSEKDETGKTGLEKLMKSGYTNEEQLVKLSEYSGTYQMGQKAVSEAGAMGLEGATKVAQMAYQTTATGSKEMGLAKETTGFDYKKREKLKESMIKELNTTAEGYVNAETPEQKAVYRDMYSAQYQQAQSMMNNVQIGQRMKPGLFNKVNEKLLETIEGKTDNAVTRQYAQALGGGVPLDGQVAKEATVGSVNAAARANQIAAQGGAVKVADGQPVKTEQDPQQIAKGVQQGVQQAQGQSQGTTPPQVVSGQKQGAIPDISPDATWIDKDGKRHSISQASLGKKAETGPSITRSDWKDAEGNIQDEDKAGGFKMRGYKSETGGAAALLTSHRPIDNKPIAELTGNPVDEKGNKFNVPLPLRGTTFASTLLEGDTNKVPLIGAGAAKTMDEAGKGYSILNTPKVERTTDDAELKATEVIIRGKIVPELDESTIPELKPLSATVEANGGIGGGLEGSPYSVAALDAASVPEKIGEEFAQTIATPSIQKPEELIKGAAETLAAPVQQLSNTVTASSNTMSATAISSEATGSATANVQQQPQQTIDTGGSAAQSAAAAAQNAALESFQNPLPKLGAAFLEQALNIEFGA